MCQELVPVDIEESHFGPSAKQRSSRAKIITLAPRPKPKVEDDIRPQLERPRRDLPLDSFNGGALGFVVRIKRQPGDPVIWTQAKCRLLTLELLGEGGLACARKARTSRIGLAL
jgi:hypothetical protein